MQKSKFAGLNEILQIAISVKDLARAIAFYRDVLGMQFLFEAPPQMAFFQCGAVRLMLGVPEKPEFDHPASIIYYKVDDIQQAHQSLADRGVNFEAEPHLIHKDDHHELWMAFLRDPDENLLAISEVKNLS